MPIDAGHGPTAKAIPVIVHQLRPKVARLFGPELALIVQQMIFIQEHRPTGFVDSLGEKRVSVFKYQRWRDGHWWFRCTVADLRNEHFSYMRRSSIRRLLDAAERMGIVLARPTREERGGLRTGLWYRVDEERLDALPDDPTAPIAGMPGWMERTRVGWTREDSQPDLAFDSFPDGGEAPADSTPGVESGGADSTPGVESGGADSTPGVESGGADSNSFKGIGDSNALETTTTSLETDALTHLARPEETENEKDVVVALLRRNEIAPSTALALVEGVLSDLTNCPEGLQFVRDRLEDWPHQFRLACARCERKGLPPPERAGVLVSSIQRRYPLSEELKKQRRAQANADRQREAAERVQAEKQQREAAVETWLAALTEDARADLQRHAEQKLRQMSPFLAQQLSHNPDSRVAKSTLAGILRELAGAAMAAERRKPFEMKRHEMLLSCPTNRHEFA